MKTLRRNLDGWMDEKQLHRQIHYGYLVNLKVLRQYLLQINICTLISKLLLTRGRGQISQSNCFTRAMEADV